MTRTRRTDFTFCVPQKKKVIGLKFWIDTRENKLPNFPFYYFKFHDPRRNLHWRVAEILMI